MAPRIREPSQRTDGFSKLALTTFRQMLKLEAQCDCDNGKCDACRAWWDKHRTLMRELELPPWCFPAVERPGTPCPYPEGSAMANTWQRDYEAEARWRRLERACRKAGPSVERVRLIRTPEMAATSTDPETVTPDRD
jgi:hypothetical protein